jgi:hypothetical protein
MKCDKCGQLTDISESGAVQRMIVQNKALKEDNDTLGESLRINRLQKIGQIQVMHKTIKRLIDVMTPEQRVKAREYNQQMRDDLKNVDKKKR